jgi:hypothetical protein
MRSVKLQKTTSIRFRRWSRAGYAVFRSLSTNVTIGCLKVGISDKSLQKSTKTASNSIHSNNFELDSPDKLKAILELEVALLQIQETSFIKITSDDAAANRPNLYYLT